MQIPQTLNITCGSDVILNITLEHDEVVINPALIDDLQVNLVSGLGKRTALETLTKTDYIVVNIPWVDGRLPGCYSLEITGSINGLAWSAVGKRLIRYTSATEIGRSSVAVSGDTYDVTMEVGYYYTDSPIEGTNISVDDNVGTPSVESSYLHKQLSMSFHNLKGNGIASIEQTVKSEDSSGINVVTITDEKGQATNVEIRNGGIGGQGIQGIPGESAVFDPNTGNIAEIKQTTGNSISSPMSQWAVTEEVNGINVTEDVIDLDNVYSYPYIINQGKWVYKTDGSFGKHINVAPGQKYKIKASDDYITRVVYFATWPYPEKNKAITYLSYEDIAAGGTQVITIPAGAFSIYIQDNTQASSPVLEIPESMSLVVSDSIRETLDWTIDAESKNAISDKEVLASYGFKDCPEDAALWYNGSYTSNHGAGFFSSEYIAIPQNATSIIYKGVQSVYRNYTSDVSRELCGLVVMDSNHVALWYNEATDGELDLSDYPTAAYVRFCPYLKNLTSTIEIVKRGGYDGIEAINGGDTIRQYGCTVEGTTTSASSTIKYLASESPCIEDGYLDTIFGKFSAGTVHLHVGYIDQNGYIVIVNSFEVSTHAGLQWIDVSDRGIKMYKDSYILAEYASGYGKPYFGVMEGSPAAFSVQQDNKKYNFDTNVIVSLAYTVKTHKPSQTEMAEELEELKTEVADNTAEIAAIKTNKTYYIEDEVTGVNYQIIVRNGELMLRPAQYGNALVLGNSITNHPVRENLWWGEWGMAATKQEYDFAHIIQEGLKTKNANAIVTPIHISEWERDFSLDLSELIGDNLTSSTDLVVIRLGENVPAANVSSFASALGTLIDYIYSVAPNAKVIITGVFWANNSKEAAIISAASAKGIDYVKINQFGIAAYEEEQGHMVYGDDEAIHAINNSGVALHPNNKGMLAIGNTILNALGYESVNKSYTLKEVTVGGVTGTMYVEDE